MGKALEMVAEQLRIPPMTDRALPPVLVLVSDGQPTDDFTAGLDALMAEPWAKKAVRIAIAIGADADMDVLQSFIGSSALSPLRADRAAALVEFIKWASTAVVKAASAPRVEPSGEVPAVPVPDVPQPVPGNAGADIVW
jgi:uncharacterized protein YegL